MILIENETVWPFGKDVFLSSGNVFFEEFRLKTSIVIWPDITQNDVFFSSERNGTGI